MRLALAVVSAVVALPAAASAQRRPTAPLPSGAWVIGTVRYGDTTWSWATLRFAADRVHSESGTPQRYALHGAVRGDSIEIVQYAAVHQHSEEADGRGPRVAKIIGGNWMRLFGEVWADGARSTAKGGARI